jgi:hypothetical protein
MKTRVNLKKNYLEILDYTRNIFIKITPEEIVRQNTILFLNKTFGIPYSVMKTEHSFEVNNRKKRADIIIFNKQKTIQVLVECKSAKTKINQEVATQISTYNLVLKAPYLIISNQESLYFWQIDFENKTATTIQEIPQYKDW